MPIRPPPHNAAPPPRNGGEQHAIGAHGRSDRRQHERGNVFLFILLGVVLFAALSYTMARSFRSEGTDRVSSRKADLAATEIIDYAQRIGRAVNSMRSKGISENDISLQFGGNYINTACNDATDPSFPACQVFHADGGRVKVQTPPENANDGSAWHFTGSSCIASAAACATDTFSNEELLAVLPNLDVKVCTAINKKLGITTATPASAASFDASQFTGSFADGTAIVLAGGPYNAACFSNGGQYHFYMILIDR